ncbi:hypothetical protein AF71_00061100 [Rhizobium sp. 57MFTsu3.2]|nr:hypothetical protein [Rhizobium sp. 57MFTsu3.2]
MHSCAIHLVPFGKGSHTTQRERWMGDASLDLARGNLSAALEGYGQRGMVRTGWTRDDAITTLIADWNRGYDPAKSLRIAVAMSGC